MKTLGKDSRGARGGEDEKLIFKRVCRFKNRLCVICLFSGKKEYLPRRREGAEETTERIMKTQGKIHTEHAEGEIRGYRKNCVNGQFVV